MASGRLAREGERAWARLERLGRAAVEAAIRAAGGESVRLRAMALTYLSLFALVPALVVAFSVVQAFTGMDRIALRVREFLLENLAVGARASIEPYLEKFVGNAHVASAGLVGGALLVWSAVSLFSNVDRAVNDIWGLRRPRRIGQQLVIYWMGLTVGPLLLAASVALAHSARAWLAGTGLGTLAAAGGVLVTCAVFALVYLTVPNTRVRVSAAVSAGLVAGLAWEGAKWGYAIATTRFLRYSVIYGSVAAVPTFLLWLFVSWTILLFGARLAFVVQYAPALWRGGPLTEHPATREVLAGRIMLEVARAHDRPAGSAVAAPDVGALAEALRVSPEEVAELVAQLRGALLLRGLSDGGLVPGRSLERISLLDVRHAVLAPPPERPGDPLDAVERALAEVEEGAAGRLGGLTLRALLDGGGAPQGVLAAATPGTRPTDPAGG